MNRPPRIVGEQKKIVQVREPPRGSGVSSHDWMSDNGNLAYREELGGKGFLEAYIRREAFERILWHANEHVDENLEVMGFLIGDAFQHMGCKYTVIDRVVTTDLEASSFSVKFHRGGFGRLFDELDAAGSERLIVGWYHSHLGYGCYLSDVDLGTQRKIFKEDFHVAIVVDPVEESVASFKIEKGGQYKEIPFGIIEG